MNVNAVRDADALDAGFYAAGCGFDPVNWRGASLYVSTDGGASYSLVRSISTAATMGYANDVLPDFAGGNIPDEISRVNVTMRNGTLSSTDFDGLLAGTNMAIIGDEIVHFRTATLEADGTYTLSGFLRGRRGSEHAMGTHAIADRFILLNTSNVYRVAQVTSDIGVEKSYKAVSSGSTLALATEKLFTNEGAGLKPYAPVQLGGGRDASNNLTINWTRRNRISGEWRDSVDVPMSETSESYEVDIYSDNTYATVVNTLTSTTPTVAYSAATQTGDGLTPGATVYFKVYQLSDTVGRGYDATGSV